MTIAELKIKAEEIVESIKDKGIYWKENTLIDYKLELNLSEGVNEVIVFLRNFAKDILAFANKEGGMLFLGFNENRDTGEITDVGLKDDNIDVLRAIDLKNLSDQFVKMYDTQINVDIHPFNIATRKFYYVLIEKQGTILIPKNDFLDCNLKKGDVIYRGAGGNIRANDKTSEFNTFIETKVNEKNKEFMQIWSGLLPEVFDINPKEILILNPQQGKVYGYNSKNKVLASTDIEIDNKEDGPINVILNAISAGEIGKISTTEGKPIYKLVGEIVLNNEKTKESTSMHSIHEKVRQKSKYKIQNIQLKKVMYYLGWVKDDTFSVKEPKEKDINPDFSDFVWIETIDDLKGSKKVVFSPKAVNPLLEIVEDTTKHTEILCNSGKLLFVPYTKDFGRITQFWGNDLATVLYATFCSDMLSSHSFSKQR